MKALLVSVKAGYGHHSAARAVIECFEKHGAECSMIDLFQCVSPVLEDGVQDGYLFLTKYMSRLYGKTYDQLAKKETPYDSLSAIQIANKLISKKVETIFKGCGADVIIATHSFAAMVMTILKERGIIDCPVYGIVTDFTVHPLWESSRLDYYVTPDKLLTRQMEKKGIPREKVLPLGIPVRGVFGKRLPQKEARLRLGIEDKRTVLIMMGSMGFGNMAGFLESVDELALDFQVLCVCGNNKRAKKQIDAKEWNKTVYSYDFIDYVDLLMDASDVLITKPGGLTTSEALAKGLPLIITNPIPGQEGRNMEFLVNAGAAIQVSRTFGVDEALYQIFYSDWRLDTLKDSVRHIGKPNAAEDLYQFIDKQLSGIERDTAAIKTGEELPAF